MDFGDSTPLDVAHARIRIAARLSNAFAMNLVQLGGFGRDIVDGLLLAAISQANIAPLMRNRETQIAYATIDQPPPDEMRRPISISGVANGLGIPFETARRRIMALAQTEAVVITPKGVVIPTAPLTSPFYVAGVHAYYSLVRALYLRLRSIGALDAPPTPAQPTFQPDNPPVRLVSRLATDYALRIAQPILAQAGDPVTGLILMDLVNANTEHLNAADDLLVMDGAMPADNRRRPIRTAHLAERLKIPHETVRRHLKRLVEQDSCERFDNGYVVTNRILTREPIVRFASDNMSHAHRLYAGLGDFGITAEWENG